ncbi:MAG TPA: hypothetical protein VMV48_07950 [Gallionellaceae bacterium]|nr:hypothetical protein [Gallionellaceae bacterium]
MSFGILTLATPNDYLKAIGLALSLKVSNPGVSLAVACHPVLRPLLTPYFDFVIDERPDIRGFAHKVYLDQYTPFDRTLFLDSDVLVFKPVAPFIKEWGDDGIPYVATGRYVTGGSNAFGFDRDALLQRMGWKRLVCIDGAGHAFFCKPACKAVFDRAREITANYKEIAGNAQYADEDVMNIVMTEFNLVVPSRYPFFSRHLSAVRGSWDMDASIGKCCGALAETGLPFEPCIMHFAENEAPFAYTLQLLKLFSKFGLPTKGLFKFLTILFWKHHIRTPIHNMLLKLGMR